MQFGQGIQIQIRIEADKKCPPPPKKGKKKKIMLEEPELPL
jgi:hypothetical protein